MPTVFNPDFSAFLGPNAKGPKERKRIETVLQEQSRNTPNLPPEALKAFTDELERERLQQRQQPPLEPQVSPAANPPPTAVPDPTANADAALLAVQALSEQTLGNQQKREAEAQSVQQLNEEADRFDNNAQVAGQAAQESADLAQENRAQADQLTQVHAEEAEAEVQQLAEVEEQAFSAEVQRVIQDPEAMARITPELGTAIGLGPDAIGPKELQDFQDVQSLINGQLDVNNAKQVALQEKIIAGEGFSTSEKITLALAAILPIIIGASRGNLASGIAAASKVVGGILTFREAAQEKREEKLGSLEQQQIDILGQREDILKTQAQTAGIEAGTEIDEAKNLREATSQQLKDVGLKLDIETSISKTLEAESKAKIKAVELSQTLKDFAEGKLGAKSKATPDQRKAAGFSVRMNQSQDVLEDLIDSNFKPFELVGERLNRTLTGNEQLFAFAARNFINAILRRESGAAISPEEHISARLQYMPQPGDGPEVLEQKRLNRRIATAGLTAEAGETAITDLITILKEENTNAASRDAARETKKQGDSK